MIVVGSGVAGLSTAITARKRGLDVVVLEKEPVFGGVLWVPLCTHGQRQNPEDTRDAVRTYMMQETGTFFEQSSVAAFIDNGPKMVDFFSAKLRCNSCPPCIPTNTLTFPVALTLAAQFLRHHTIFAALAKTWRASNRRSRQLRLSA